MENEKSVEWETFYYYPTPYPVLAKWDDSIKEWRVFGIEKSFSDDEFSCNYSKDHALDLLSTLHDTECELNDKHFKNDILENTNKKLWQDIEELKQDLDREKRINNILLVAHLKK